MLTPQRNIISVELEKTTFRKRFRVNHTYKSYNKSFKLYPYFIAINFFLDLKKGWVKEPRFKLQKTITHCPANNSLLCGCRCEERTESGKTFCQVYGCKDWHLDPQTSIIKAHTENHSIGIQRWNWWMLVVAEISETRTNRRILPTTGLNKLKCSRLAQYILPKNSNQNTIPLTFWLLSLTWLDSSK